MKINESKGIAWTSRSAALLKLAAKAKTTRIVKRKAVHVVSTKRTHTVNAASVTHIVNTRRAEWEKWKAERKAAKQNRLNNK